MPWPATALVGGALAALGGLVIVAVVVAAGWFGTTSIDFSLALAFAGQVWLLGHGAGLVVAGLRITLMPLGLTLLLALLAGIAGSAAFRAPGPADGSGLRRRVGFTAAGVALGYAVVVAAVGVLVHAELGAGVPGGVLIAGGSALVGASRRAGSGVPGSAWWRSGVRGAGAGVLALVVVAAIPLAVAMINGETRIAALEGPLGFDAVATVVWAVICLLYLPTALGWTAAWVMGAGFTLGDGSLVAPWVTRLGLLPSVPIFGALPDDGAGPLVGWLALAAVPGLVAGLAAVRARPSGVVAAIGAGAVAGTLLGAAYLTWGLASRGALGVDRFESVGPRFPELFIGVGIVLLTSVLGAAVAWFIDRRAGSAD